MRRPRTTFGFSLLLSLSLAATAPAQLDVGVLVQRRSEAEAAVQTALQASERALAAVRKALVDPDNKLQGTCDDMANVLKGSTFDAAIGTVPIALGNIDDHVPEERRAATRAALGDLLRELTAGSLALARFESLQELVARGEQLQALGADDDATSLLADLAQSAGRATRAGALPRADLLRLQQFLQQQRQRAQQKAGGELLAQAKTELAQLRTDVAGMRAEMQSQDASERDRGFARFDDPARSIATALARVPAADSATLQKELNALQAETDALYMRAYGAATLQRLQDTWAFTADTFTGWNEEPGEITAPGYITFDPPSVDKLTQPQTINLVERANLFFAFVGTDADAQRNLQHPPVTAFVQSIREQQAAAHQKLLRAARAVVDGLPTIEITDERVRGRLQTLADWDLPLALQNHPEQAALVDRVHALLDAHDRKSLGDDKALATIREQALTAADGLWPRGQQWQPCQGGFEPTQAALFTGRQMRLDAVWLRTDEFAAKPGEVVFDLGGHVFVGTLAPGVAAAIRTQRTRLQRTPVDTLGGDEACELLAVVGEPTEVRLLGPKGAEDAIPVAARALRITGLRQGAVFTIAP